MAMALKLSSLISSIPKKQHGSLLGSYISPFGSRATKPKAKPPKKQPKPQSPKTQSSETKSGEAKSPKTQPVPKSPVTQSSETKSGEAKSSETQPPAKSPQTHPIWKSLKTQPIEATETKSGEAKSTQTQPIKLSEPKSGEVDAGGFLQKILNVGMAGDVQEIGMLHNKMSSIYTQGAFGKAIDSFGGKLEPDQVLRMFEMMEKSRLSGMGPLLPPSMQNFLIGLIDEKIDSDEVIQYVSKSGRADLGFHLLVMSRRKLLGIQKSTYQELILGLCETRWIDQCMMVLDEIFDVGIVPEDMDFYVKVIPFVNRANEPYKVLKLFKMMKDDLGLEPEVIDLKLEGLTLNFLCDDTLDAFCHLWKFEDAASLILDNDICCAYEKLLGTLCSYGMFDQAIDFHKKLVERRDADIPTWTVLIRAFWEEGEDEKSFEVFKDMLSWYHEREGTRGRVLTLEKFKMLISGLWNDKIWTEESHFKDDASALWYRIEQKLWHYPYFRDVKLKPMDW